MREKGIKIKGKRYKDLYSQIFNLIFLLGVLFEEINHHIALWAIIPVILAIIVIISLIQITYIYIIEENKKIGKVILRCYRWEAYTGDVNGHEIYRDPYVYAEIECDDFTYSKFIQVYNTKEKIKNLVYKEFRTYIVIE